MRSFTKSLLCTALATFCFSSQAAENIYSPLFGESRPALYTEVSVIETSNVPSFTELYADEMVKQLGERKIVNAVQVEIKTIKAAVEDYSEFRATASKQLPVLEKFDPDMHAYVVRLAKLIDLPLDDLWVSFYVDAAWVASVDHGLDKAWNNNTELKQQALLQMDNRRGGCTTMAWTNGVLGGNEDFASVYGGQYSLMKSSDLLYEGSYYGAWRAQGKHLGLVVNTLVADSQGDGANGLPHSIIIASLVRRAHDVPQALEMLESIKGESPFNYTMADTSGNALAYNIIKKPSHSIVEPVNGAVTHTNHRSQSRDLILQAWNGDYKKANESMNYSLARRDIADSLTQIVPLDERTPETMKTILRTQPILAKAARGVDFGTIYSYIMDLPQGCIYMAPDRPDLVDYTKVCFDN